MPTARMDEVVRQCDADLKAAVLHRVVDELRLARMPNGTLRPASFRTASKARMTGC